MAGRGLVEKEDSLAYPRVYSLDQEMKWTGAKDPIHFDKPVAGVGPGRTIGIQLAEENSSIAVGLIPSAVGGSAISTWEPGGFHEGTSTHPYDDMLKRARHAMRFGRLKVAFWHQGESDSNAENAAEYESKLRKLISRLRQDLGVPDLPFVIGQLGQFQEWDQWRTSVNQAQMKVAQSDPRVFFVPSDHLVHKGDSVHFSNASMREMGLRFAKTYIEISK